MKRILIFLAIACMAVASCRNQNNTTPMPEEETYIANDDETCDSIYSSDLAFYRLHGPVHKVTYAEIGLEYEFDEAGNLISFLGHDPFIKKAEIVTDTLGNSTEYSAFKRNENGQIAQIFGVNSVNTYIWEDGLVIGDEGSSDGLKWICSYEHDKFGNASYQHARYIDIINNVESSGTTTYTILKKDSHGNWIIRSEKYIPDTPSETNKETPPYNQSRTITYYK